MVYTPPTTTLAVLDEDWELPSQSWCKPFEKLLISLRIISDSDVEAEIKGQDFCFQHARGLSELSRVFLWVHTSGFDYKINIDDIQFHGSDLISGMAWVTQLTGHAKRVLSRVQKYCDRLIEHGIIPDTSAFDDVNLLTCPLCYSHLRSCIKCDAAVACPNYDCAGSQVVDCEQCGEHDWMTCHECLRSKERDPSPRFVRCPSCNSWCCSLEVDWCPGKIVHPAPGAKGLIMRSHLSIPGPCRSCIDSGHTDAWQACSGGRSALCPSNAGRLSELILNYVYCPECRTEHKGQRCACGAVWVCDACPVADPLGYPDFVSCPRCGSMYCTREDGCQYCDCCRICYRSGICFGCQAQEKGVGGEERSQPLNAFERCVECQSTMCNECCSAAKLGVVQCSSCRCWICGNCANDRRRPPLCNSCHVP